MDLSAIAMPLSFTTTLVILLLYHTINSGLRCCPSVISSPWSTGDFYSAASDSVFVAPAYA